MTLLFRAQEKAGFPLFNQRSEMIKMVHELESQRDKLQTDLAEKNKILEEFEKSAGNRTEMFKALQNQLTSLRADAGYTAVEGEGLIMVLTDSIKKPSPNDDPYYYVVHDMDLLILVNELWASGAEAIAINEQRIISSSSIRCVGPTVLVNGVRLSSPYKVKAIGPSNDMDSALKMTGGYMDSMLPSLTKGVKIQITTYPKVQIGPFKGSMTLRYAQPVETDGASK